MPITPVEVASFVPKSQEASQMKSLESQKPAAEQLAYANRMKEEIQHNSEQAVAATKSDTPEFRYDAKEKGNNPYYFSQKKKKKKDGDSVVKGELPREHHEIDIKI